MDIVYPVKKNASNEELKYSLRSLQNIQHDKVFIVGDLPNFIDPTKVVYIPNQMLANRYETTTNHLKCACLNEKLSDTFIYMNDDFFILEPISDQDLMLNRGLLKDQVKFYYTHHRILTNFDKLIEKGMNELKALGFNEPISFELHSPMIINKYNFLTLKINTPALYCCKRSLYGNYFIKNSKTISDVKLLGGHIFNENVQGKQKILSCSDSSFTKIKDFLNKKFPNKSIYEK